MKPFIRCALHCASLWCGVLSVLSVAFLLLAGCALAPHRASLWCGVAPQTCAIALVRDNSVDAFASDMRFYRGLPAVLNLACYSGGDTSSVPENLTNVTVTVTLGTLDSNIAYAATVQTPSNGLARAWFLFPTNWVTPYLWIQLTDQATNIFIYPRKILKTVEAP